ncbi:MAG TPA: hypothetical protein QF761_04765 [Pirellulales bacterium]|nr:hypothetical protein [Pirellulales bacterium]
MSKKPILPLSFSFAALLSCLACGLLVATMSADETDHPHPEELPGRLLTDGKTFGNNPAVAADQHGNVFVAWIRHHTDEGDEVVVSEGNGKEVAVLTPELGQYLRPVLAATDSQVHCVWTQTNKDRVSTIWQAVRRGGIWSPGERLLPDEKRAHQNPEIAATADGRVAVVYQLHNGDNYEIQIKDKGMVRRLSSPTINAWDPSIVFSSSGVWHVAWSGFSEGDYDIHYQREGVASPRRISSRGQYDLHPALAASVNDLIWICWDAVEIPGHANSGSTTIIGANPGHNISSNYGKGQNSWIEVRVIDDDTILLPGNPREEIVPPPGYRTGHAALPKIVTGHNGSVWIAYRALHKQRGGWLASGGTSYYWDLLARPLEGKQWGKAERLQHSDGYLEEPSMASGPETMYVAYGGEQRLGSHERLKRAREGKPPAKPDPHNHHSDFFGRVGCNGEVFLATLPRNHAQKLALSAAPPIKDRPMPSRIRQQPYEVKAGNKTYRLLWGDTHRHSNVSRCSVGLEPTPDDLYRYGDDICNYDFFALSDHGEQFQDTTADAGQYYWWLNLKLADLYHIPDYMSVLYNYEWTMDFPHGHHNVLFPGRPTLRMDRTMAESDTLAKGWQTLKDAQMRAITIPHTGADPGQGTAWQVQDDELRRVVEIFQSARGSYEHDGCPRQWHNSANKKGFYWKALEKGFHLGVIASSDHGYGVAYACVYAEENSRESIWQAIWDRRCYGSTTYGLLLDVRSGEHFMGEEWTAAEAPEIEVFAQGPVPIRSVEIIGRSQILHTEGSQKEPLKKLSHRFRWTDPDWAAQDAEQWYYVRVILQNDEIAWSSPIWVTPAKAKKDSS